MFLCTSAFIFFLVCPLVFNLPTGSSSSTAASGHNVFTLWFFPKVILSSLFGSAKVFMGPLYAYTYIHFTLLKRKSYIGLLWCIFLTKTKKYSLVNIQGIVYFIPYWKVSIPLRMNIIKYLHAPTWTNILRFLEVFLQRKNTLEW